MAILRREADRQASKYCRQESSWVGKVALEVGADGNLKYPCIHACLLPRFNSASQIATSIQCRADRSTHVRK